jgi:type III pantothenate kinase
VKLFVDVGNSRIKWAFGVAGRFIAEGEASGSVDGSLDDLLGFRQPLEEIRIANVAGADTGSRIAAMLQERFRIEPVLAGSAAVGAGVRNGYSDPGQLGIDRWLAVCGAFSRFQAPVCVVDAGTATTIDLVTASGEHKGGLILPGIDLMQSALLRGTGNLALLSAGADPGMYGRLSARGLSEDAIETRVLLGRGTAAAIRYGALQATACLAGRCMDELCSGPSVAPGSGVLVVTGGAAQAVQAELLRLGGFQGPARRQGHRLEYRNQLVLEGLALEPPCFTIAK